MAKVTEQIFFSGRVQGVGFRWTTERLAAKLPLTGWVRNLPDGRVEAIARGEPEAVSRLIERLQDHFGAAITGIERGPGDEQDQFSGFTIRR